MPTEHLPLIITLVASLGLVLCLAGLSLLLGPKRLSPVKLETFECGNPPSGDARERFSAKFYLVAILFLVFDVEAVFIYPWAVVFSDSVRGQSSIPPLWAFASMLAFVGVMLVALIYAWRKGALDWSASS